jgi:hypothetical protein
VSFICILWFRQVGQNMIEIGFGFFFNILWKLCHVHCEYIHRLNCKNLAFSESQQNCIIICRNNHFLLNKWIMICM